MRLVTNNPYKYKYNGVEYQDELGLNMYDMDMRQYDPAIARWVVLDPVIHHSMSPYNAFDNNPVFWADPSGADAEQSSGSSDSNNSDSGSKDYNPSGVRAMGIPIESIAMTSNIVSYNFSDSYETTKTRTSTMTVGEDNPESLQNLPDGVSVPDETRDYLSGASVRTYTSTTTTYHEGGADSPSTFEIEIWGMGAYDDLLHNHKTYKTTQGIEKNIYKANGKPRSRRATNFARTSRFVKALGVAGFGLGIFMDYTKMRSGEISGTKFGLNVGMGAIGFTAVGAPASIMYGTVEAIHPQGWDGYSKDYQRLQTENAAINPGFITAPYGSQKF